MANDILLINTDSEPVRRMHIAYAVDRAYAGSVRVLRLIAVEECFYPHPEAPEHALVQRIETRIVMECAEGTAKAAPLFLLWNAQENVAPSH